MGTPHRGTGLAFFGEMLARIAKVAFLRPAEDHLKDLRNSLNTLMDVSEDFRSIAEKYTIISSYEDLKIKCINKEVFKCAYLILI